MIELTTHGIWRTWKQAALQSALLNGAVNIAGRYVLAQLHASVQILENTARVLAAFRRSLQGNAVAIGVR